MSRITNKHREEFLDHVLRERFAPRFDDIQKRVSEAAKRAVAEQHPAFVKAVADKVLSQYLATRSTIDVQFEDSSKPRSPRNWATCNATNYAQQYCGLNEGLERIDGKCSAPAYHGTTVRLGDEQFLHDYHTLWGEFAAAQKTLKELIYSYTTTDKFDKDFPELKKYLPRTEVVGPLVVPVDDLKLRLSALGIPPAVSV